MPLWNVGEDLRAIYLTTIPYRELIYRQTDHTVKLYGVALFGRNEELTAWVNFPENLLKT